MKTTILSTNRIIALGCIAIITSLTSGCYTPQSAYYDQQPAYVTAYSYPVYRPVFVNVNRPLPGSCRPVVYERPCQRPWVRQESHQVPVSAPARVAPNNYYQPQRPYAFVNY